jgi:hypothetical protein
LQCSTGGARHMTSRRSTDSDGRRAQRHQRRLPHSAQPSAPRMSAEAAALQQLRGLIAALGARELSALSEATVTSLRVAAKSVERLACAGASEHARGCWEAALELWCVICLRDRRFAHSAAAAWVATTTGWLRCGVLDEARDADRAPSCSQRATGTWLLR